MEKYPALAPEVFWKPALGGIARGAKLAEMAEELVAGIRWSAFSVLQLDALAILRGPWSRASHDGSPVTLG